MVVTIAAEELQDTTMDEDNEESLVLRERGEGVMREGGEESVVDSEGERVVMGVEL